MDELPIEETVQEKNKYEPTFEDKCLHKQNIYKTVHKNFWLETIDYLSNHAFGTVFNNLRTADVSFSLTACNTACIYLDNKKVFINPTFFRIHVNKVSDLAGLILHELFHIVIDPERKFPGDHYTNIAMDAVINSMLWALYPGLTSLMEGYYKTDEFCGSLLRPGARNERKLTSLDKEDSKFLQMKGLDFKANSIHSATYKNIFPVGQEIEKSQRPSIQDIIDRFIPNIEEKRKQLAEGKIIILSTDKTLSDLGSSEPIKIKDLMKDLNKEDQDKLKELLDKVEEAGNEQKDKDGGKQAGKAKTLEEKYVDLAKEEDVLKSEAQTSIEERMEIAKDICEGVLSKIVKRNPNDSLKNIIKNYKENYLDKDIQNAFIRASLKDVRGEIVNKLEYKTNNHMSFLPFNLTRSGASLLAMDEMPSLWKRKRHTKEEESRSTRIYIDFSGSMESHIPWVMQLVKSMKNKCHSDIYSFSVSIIPTTIEEIEAGKYSTEYGTNFGNVVEHFLDKCDANQALIITDGQDSISKEMIDKLKSSNKKMFGLIVGSYRPSEYTVENMMEWCHQVWLQEYSWWNDLRVNK